MSLFFRKKVTKNLVSEKTPLEDHLSISRYACTPGSQANARLIK